MNIGERPAFMDAPLPEEQEALDKAEAEAIEEESNEIEKLWQSDRRLKPKYEVMAYLLAVGSTQAKMCKQIGITQAWASTLLKKRPEIRIRANEIQEHYFGKNIDARFDAAMPMAMDVVEAILKDGEEKTGYRLDAAKWLLEKTTGKATQHISNETNVFVSLIDKFDKMAQEGRVLDVTPTDAEGKV